MCSTSAYDLEEIPLDDDDSNSIEFKILAFYARHHVFRNSPADFSPELLRTSSLSQKGLRSWSANDSQPQVSWPCRNSRSSEKPIRLPRKKLAWKTFFRGAEEGDDSQSSCVEAFTQGGRTVESQGLSSQKWSRSLSTGEQHLEPEAVDPKVVSIANRVAEIVHSWPPPEQFHLQGGGIKAQGNRRPQALCLQDEGSQPSTSSSKKDGEEQVIAKIVELLKSSGDQMERELKKGKALVSSFPDELSYSVCKTIIDQFLRGVDTRGESEIKAQGFKAALAIDVIAKLTAIDNHPMNRVLGFGAKYLKENFSPWVQQHGGWEKILGISHEEVD
ncbi:apoptosis facilitator Bcl-2-like protein 14 [Cynocephalus volans]|uniref:apoptosis facilitator Bcl-2-like protein 14 n=1 Tax=Cynocephalus volans TaxID=110931 RepID=UPI002FCB9916